MMNPIYHKTSRNLLSFLIQMTGEDISIKSELDTHSIAQLDRKLDRQLIFFS